MLDIGFIGVLISSIKLNIFMRIKILSWNLWTEGKFNLIADFLKTADADIVGLQEVLDDDPQRNVIGLLKGLGYEGVFAPARKEVGKEIWNDGPAIFSKLKIVETKTYMLSEISGRAAVKADVQIGNKIIHIFNTHLKHTHQQETELQNLQAENLIKILPKENTILMGDFNATPGSSVIKEMAEIMVDSDPASTPTLNPALFDCSGCEAGKIANTRLDYIFTTKDIKASSFKVHSAAGSDHLPISVIITV